MDNVEWNKKEELVAEQALKHLMVEYIPGLSVLCVTSVYRTILQFSCLSARQAHLN